jgi:hypothetical protein
MEIELLHGCSDRISQPATLPLLGDALRSTAQSFAGQAAWYG